MPEIEYYRPRKTIGEKLEDARIILIDRQIDTNLASYVIMNLLALDNENQKPINMYFNSPGGSVIDGLAIFDVMKAVRSPIHTICMGIAASMAAILLCCGDHRAATPNAEIMIHQASGGMQGKVTDINIQVAHIIRIEETIYRIMSEHTGKTPEQLKQDCRDDNYMTAQEALEYNLIDEILIPEAKTIVK